MAGSLDKPLGAVWRTAWLRRPEPDVYAAFPRAVVVDGTWYIKYQVGIGTGQPGVHALPPIREHVMTWNPCSGTGVADEGLRAWHERMVDEGRNLGPFVPLLADGAAIRWLVDQGWTSVNLGGPAFPDAAQRAWLWPLYGRPPGSADLQAVIVRSPPSADSFELVHTVRLSAERITELGGAVLGDDLLVVVRRGTDQGPPAHWRLVHRASAAVLAQGDLPTSLHWPVFCDAGALGLLLIGRTPGGLTVFTRNGAAWDTRTIDVAPAASWFGNAGYAAAAYDYPGTLRIVNYGPRLATEPERAGEKEFPGIFQSTVLLCWVERVDGSIEPFRPGDARVANGTLVMREGIRAIRRVPIAALGPPQDVGRALFNGPPPPLLDYEVRLG